MTYKKIINKIKKIHYEYESKKIIQKIKDNIKNIPYNNKAIFDDTNIARNAGVYKFISPDGETGLAGIKHEPSIEAYNELEKFTRKGGRLIYLPMYAGIPTKKNASIYSIIGYANNKPARAIQISKTINIVNGDMVPPGRFYPMSEIEKKYDFLILSWAGNIKHKRWDLALEAIRKLCPKYKMCLIAYHGTPNKKDQALIDKYVKNKNLKFINGWVDKEKLPIILNSSRVLYVPCEWDNKPRIMDQAMLCNIPIIVNKNIYGGLKFITADTGMASPPEKMPENARKVLNTLAGKVKSRDWYFKNHGVYNTMIDLTKLVNKTFNTNFKIIYENNREFLFQKEYIKKLKMPSYMESKILFKIL